MHLPAPFRTPEWLCDGRHWVRDWVPAAIFAPRCPSPLAALTPRARPGLEPGTPRFSVGHSEPVGWPKSLEFKRSWPRHCDRQKFAIFGLSHRLWEWPVPQAQLRLVLGRGVGVPRELASEPASNRGTTTTTQAHGTPTDLPRCATTWAAAAVPLRRCYAISMCRWRLPLSARRRAMSSGLRVPVVTSKEVPHRGSSGCRACC
jgi:hypothetical protein